MLGLGELLLRKLDRALPDTDVETRVHERPVRPLDRRKGFDRRLVERRFSRIATSLRAMRMTPLALLRTALDAPNTLRSVTAKRYRGELMDGVQISGRDTATMYFDRGNGLLTIIETLTDDPILGDRRTATWYSRWQDAGPVKTPRQMDIEVNGAGRGDTRVL